MRISDLTTILILLSWGFYRFSIFTPALGFIWLQISSVRATLADILSSPRAHCARIIPFIVEAAMMLLLLVFA